MLSRRRCDSGRPILGVAQAALAFAALASCGNGHEPPVSGDGTEARQAATVIAQADADAESAQTGVRRALLIGVGDYKFDDVPEERRRMGKKKSFPEDLGGAVNDVRMMEQVLVRRFAFEPQNIVVLTDSQATREAVLAAMETIVAEAGPDDVVYIHFSGHGSWIKDADGDEEDGFDETIMPYDARTDSVPDITDDELNAILSKLNAKDALIALDSCHSGTATRGETDIVTRGGDPDPAVELYTGVASRGQIGRGALVDASQTVLPETEHYVLMTGAAAEHSALDSPIDSDVRYGWFSWSLANTLSTVDQDTPAGEVFFRVQQRMYNVGEKKGRRAPMPQLEATDGARARPLLAGGDLAKGGRKVATRTWINADPAGEGKAVLRMGPLFGAVEGSLWAIYPPDTTDFVNTPQFGTAVVKSRDGDDSIAALEVTGSVEPGSRAVLVAPSWRQARTRIWLDRMSDTDQKQFRSAVTASRVGDEVLFVDATEPARFVVDIENGKVRIFSPGKLQEIESFDFVDMPSAAKRAVEIFARSDRVADLQALDNPASDIRLAVELHPVDADGKPSLKAVEDSQPVPLYKVWPKDGKRTRQNHLFLEISADREVYITAVQIGPTGAVDIFFPVPVPGLPEFYPKGLIPANEVARIPDSLDNPKAGFLYSMEPPTGQYTLRVFAATDLETARRIREYIGEYRIAEDALAADCLYRGTDCEFKASTAEQRGEAELSARGVGVSVVAPVKQPDWTATSVSFVVEH